MSNYRTTVTIYIQGVGGATIVAKSFASGKDFSMSDKVRQEYAKLALEQDN